MHKDEYYLGDKFGKVHINRILNWMKMGLMDLRKI